MMKIITILKQIITHRNSLFKAFLGLCVAFLLCCSIILHKQNKKLTESLEKALNNIEAYEGIVNGSQEKNRILRLTINELQNSKDSALIELENTRKKLKIKPKEIQSVATQTQFVYVTDSRGLGGLVIVKDSIYCDTITFNPETKVAYTIGKDTINIDLSISNTLHLFITKKREYKNKKKFLKRLFTLDFKKVNRYLYEIHNSNDLINTTDVRVIEISNK